MRPAVLRSAPDPSDAALASLISGSIWNYASAFDLGTPILTTWTPNLGKETRLAALFQTAMTSAYLIDASPYIFRAYFSLPDSIRDRDGKPAQAVHGFVSFLLKLIAEENPSHLAVCFDRSLSSSFRNEIYPPYKAQ